MISIFMKTTKEIPAEIVHPTSDFGKIKERLLELIKSGVDVRSFEDLPLGEFRCGWGDELDCDLFMHAGEVGLSVELNSDETCFFVEVDMVK